MHHLISEFGKLASASTSGGMMMLRDMLTGRFVKSRE